MVLFLALLDTQEEQEKFREIYENYRHFMWYIAQQKLKDTHLAEDAVQEAFLALTRHLDKVEDAHSPRTKKFLATIIRSKAIDLIRKNNPQEELTDELPEGKAGRDILDQLLVKENYNRLISCVLELDDSYRVVFEYKYLYQMSDEEIADILGISAKNVNVRYFRARKKLQEDLSFVPHEREIAGKHRFSPGFEEQMEAMMTEAEQKMQEKELKKHFHFQWGQLAACVAVFCVCGALAGTVYLQHSGGKGNADTTAMMTAESADVAEESAELEVAEDAMEDAADTGAADGLEAEKTADVDTSKGKTYCGQTIYLAEIQDMPEALENVNTLVNCPVLDEENPTLTLTIANTGETSTSYQMPPILEVWLDDGWYVIPTTSTESKEPTWTRLEEKMAMDEAIDLTQYQIDYGAQRYRLVVRIGEHMLSAEFTFEEVFSEQMETLEEMRKEREE